MTAPCCLFMFFGEANALRAAKTIELLTLPPPFFLHRCVLLVSRLHLADDANYDRHKSPLLFFRREERAIPAMMDAPVAELVIIFLFSSVFGVSCWFTTD